MTRRSRARNALIAGTIGGFLAPASAVAEGISTYGTPGLIDMPNARTTRDGLITLTSTHLAGHSRNSLHFQISERLSGVFRYSVLRGYFADPTEPNLFDRSFDLHYQLREEGPWMPALAFGLRDFGGTGIFGSEYIVGTKQLGTRLTLSAGLGWGRLASRGGFSNPLGILGSSFDERPRFDNMNQTGRVAFNRFFRGDAAAFGGIEYQLTPKTRLVAEYSTDAYVDEVTRMGFAQPSPLNLGVNYRATENLTLDAFVLGGTQVGLGLNYVIDPRRPRFAGGIERDAPVLRPQGNGQALGWTLPDVEGNRARLKSALLGQGLGLESYVQDGDLARIVLLNPRYPAQAQALGRAARVMANTLPSGLDRFEITLLNQGAVLSRSSFRRGDLTALEHEWDGSWQSFARAEIRDGFGAAAPDRGVYPKLEWSILPYYGVTLFDPDAPARFDIGAEAAARYHLRRGLSFTGVVRQKLLGNLDTSTRLSDSVLPHVRSDQLLYDKATGVQVPVLTADYRFRPAPNFYGRLSAGYFEQMFAGVSGEVLWYPVDSRLALGAEVNYVKQRAIGQTFGLTDYQIATGHVSGYYDFGKSYYGQVDVGRYLAGDWGATLALDREFDNGFRMGAFMTLTDVSFDRFGEGSFDKGVRFSVPVTWLTGEPGQSGISQTIRPIQRDGGARLAVSNRLYEQVRGGNANDLENRWGKFWR